MARRQSFLQGALVLGLATILVKVIGAMFKIPLANLIGGVGMGDFSIAYDIFRPFNALAIAGLPVAVSKLVSEQVALGRYRDARRILHLSVGLFLATGVLGTLAMLLGAQFFAGLLGSGGSWLCIAALAPAVFFCCMMSAYRGYYQGLKNMVPTALSQLLEAVVKLLAGILLASLFMGGAARSLEGPGSPLRTLMGPGSQDSVIVYQCGAVGAVLGVSLSTAAGTLLLFLRHLLLRDGITARELAAAPAPAPGGRLLGRMVKIAVPVCLASLVVHLTTLIDLMSIMNRLDFALRTDAPAVLALYAGKIPAGYGRAEVSKYLYGAYSGMAVNIFNLIPSLTTALGVSILPAISSAWALRDKNAVAKGIQSALRITCLLAIPAGLGLIALAHPITTLLYGARPMESAIAAGLLRRLGVPVILVSLATPLSAMLQAVGRADVPVKLMAAGGAIKLATNFLLVGVPGINIQGAPVGTALCYLFIVAMGLRALLREAGARAHLGAVFLKPLLAGLCCAVAAGSAWGLSSRALSPAPATVLSIAIGGLFYLAVLLLTRTLRRDDVIMLPGGEKIAKILEKHALIG